MGKDYIEDDLHSNMDYIRKTVNNAIAKKGKFQEILEGDDSNDDKLRAIADLVADSMNRNEADNELFDHAREAFETVTDETDLESNQKEVLTHYLEDLMEQDMSNNGAIHYAQEQYQEGIDEFFGTSEE